MSRRHLQLCFCTKIRSKSYPLLLFLKWFYAGYKLWTSFFTEFKPTCKALVLLLSVISARRAAGWVFHLVCCLCWSLAPSWSNCGTGATTKHSQKVPTDWCSFLTFRQVMRLIYNSFTGFFVSPLAGSSQCVDSGGGVLAPKACRWVLRSSWSFLQCRWAPSELHNLCINSKVTSFVST